MLNDIKILHRKCNSNSQPTFLSKFAKNDTQNRLIAVIELLLWK